MKDGLNGEHADAKEQQHVRESGHEAQQAAVSAALVPMKRLNDRNARDRRRTREAGERAGAKGPQGF